MDIADIGSPTGEGTRDESGAANRLRRSGGVGFPCAPAGLTHERVGEPGGFGESADCVGEDFVVGAWRWRVGVGRRFVAE